MNTTFESIFAERLAGFLKQKRALGYSYSSVSDFRIFYRMCAERFPDESKLTTDICNAWVTRRENESVKTTARRMPFIREFARYLLRNGEQAYEYKWVSRMFRETRKKLRVETRTEKPPRLFDLRHTFATHRLYQWMRAGKDLYAMMPYLSSYMGHARLNETFYYIHLVPGMLETMSGFRYESMADIFPKAVEIDE